MCHPVGKSWCFVGTMELKVWVEGVVRVVSGLSLNTSCQDVVIALAQAIGKSLSLTNNENSHFTLTELLCVSVSLVFAVVNTKLQTAGKKF